MNSCRGKALAGILSALLLGGDALASQDGIELRLEKGPGAGVTLNWTGGLPAFEVHRSTTPGDVSAPGRLLAETNGTSFVDSTPSGVSLHFYHLQEVCPGGRCPLAEVPEPAPAEPSRDRGACPPATFYLTIEESDRHNGIRLFSGEFHLSAVDLHIKGRGFDFAWARSYRSRTGPFSAMGHGWDYSYNLRVTRNGPDVYVQDGNTRSDLYVAQEDGTWARRGFFQLLTLEEDGRFRLTFPDKGQWNFRPLDGSLAQGRIATIVDRNGNTMSFAYDGAGRLASVTDTLGRVITVQYGAGGFIESVTDFSGRQVRYAHYGAGDPGGSAGDLASVTTPAVVGTPNENDFPLGKTTVYTYSRGMADPLLDHNLLTITDPKGQTFLRNTYNPTSNPADPGFDHLTRQEWGDPGDVVDVAYVSQVPDAMNGFARNKAIVNDRLGNVREYLYDSRNRLVVRRLFTGRADPDLPTTDSSNRPTGQLRPGDPADFETRWTYNEDSLPTSVTRPNLDSTVASYEIDLDPLAPRRSRGNLRQVTRNPGPLGGDQTSITESFTYEPGFGGSGCGTPFVRTATDGRGNTTTHGYDAKGNRIHTTHRVGGGIEDWSFNEFGQVTSHVRPADGSGRRRVDAYVYHTFGPQMGYLQSEVVDSGGFNLATGYEYDAVGNVVRKVLPSGADRLYTYNALDQVVRELSPEVLPGVRYETLTWYDANDNIVRTDVDNRDEHGVLQPNNAFSTLREYEILNRPTRMCRERGVVILGNGDLDCASLPLTERVTTEYAYDANRNHVLTRHGEAANGNDPFNTTTALYDERDLLFRSVRAAGSPLQSTDQTDYDGNRNVSTESRGLESAPRVRTYAYDGYGRRMTATDPMGNVTTFHYDANGNVLSERVDGELYDVPGSAGNLRLSDIAYQYDAVGRLIRRDVAHFDTNPPQPLIGDGFSTTQWIYSDSSQVVSTSEDNPGHVTVYAYDTADRRSTVTDARGNTIAYAYDAHSNVVQTVENDVSDLGGPNPPIVTTHAYDPIDRLTATTDNLGFTHGYAYDSRGNRVLYTDARGTRLSYEYDGLDRLVGIVRDMDANGVFGDPVDIVIAQSWDDSSRLTGRTDDNLNVTTYRYDSLDRFGGSEFADCTADSVQYDVHDNPVATLDANGSSVVNGYDLLDRVTNRTISPGAGVSSSTTYESFAFDGMSRLVRAQDNGSLVTRGSGTSSGYDSLSNVLRESQKAGGSSPMRTVTVEYDGESNPTRLVYPGGRTVVRSYDLLGRPLVVDDSPPSGAPIAAYAYVGPRRVERRDYGNATRYEPQYDPLRRIVGTSHSLIGGGVIDERTYDWDPNDNKVAMHLPTTVPPEDRFYAYDAANRLVQSRVIAGGPPAITDYVLDGVGNRVSVSGGTTPGPYTMDATLCEPADYAMNQYTTTPADPQRLYDANGNLASIPGRSLFTYDYRNRLVQYTDLVSGQTTTYKYDCLGRRIERVADGVRSRFYYDGWQEIEEQNASDATAATFVWGQDVADLLQMARGGQQHYFHADDLGSVIKATDASGHVAESYAYADYGKPSFFDRFGYPIGQSYIGNPYTFTSRRYDKETGFYYLIMRYLDPVAGRFTTRDVIGIWGDPRGLGSGYTYAANNPLSCVDPFGLAAQQDDHAADVARAKALEALADKYEKELNDPKTSKERKGILQKTVKELREAADAMRDRNPTVRELGKRIAEKSLADLNAITLAADLVVLAFNNLVAAKAPAVPIAALLKAAKWLAEMKRLKKAVEALDKAIDLAEKYEKIEDVKEKAEKVKELEEAVRKVKDALDKK